MSRRCQVGGILTRREVIYLDCTLRAIYNDLAAGRTNQNRARRALLTIKKAARRTTGNNPNLFTNTHHDTRESL